MIEVNNKWELSESEQYVIDYLNKKGFNGELSKQYVSKTYFNLNKKGISTILELPQGLKRSKYDYKSYIDNWYNNNWKMLVMLEEIKL